MGDRLNLQENSYIFKVEAPAATSAAKRAQLECWIDRIKPANSLAIYEYTL